APRGGNLGKTGGNPGGWTNRAAGAASARWRAARAPVAEQRTRADTISADLAALTALAAEKHADTEQDLWLRLRQSAERVTDMLHSGRTSLCGFTPANSQREVRRGAVRDAQTAGKKRAPSEM